MKRFVLIISLVICSTVLGDSVMSNLPSTKENKSEKNQPNGYAGLDGNGKISSDFVDTITVVFVGGPAIGP